MIDNLPIPQNRLLMFSFRGSHARNMATENSDIDYIGVYVAPLNHYFGFNRKDTIDSNVDKNDLVLYDLRKYVTLLAANNPNILESIYTKNPLYTTETFNILLKNRSLFSSKQVYHTFTNYAAQQMHRMVSMTEELVDEIEDLELLLIAEGLDIKELSPKQSERDRILTFGKYKDRKLDNAIQRYVEIKKKHLTGGGRLGEKRKNLIKKYHFDCKNASVLVMLMKQCIEFLNTGELVVDRSHDKNELLSIKNGEWKLEDVKKYVDNLRQSATLAYEKSSLPEKVNYDKVELLLVNLLKDAIYVLETKD